MQWNGNANAGFTAAGVTPWLPVSPGYESVNVQAQEDAAESHLKVYRALCQMRAHKSILFGATEAVVIEGTEVFALNRVKKGNPGFLVLANLGDEDAEGLSVKAPEPGEDDEDKEKQPDPISWLPDTGTVHLRSVATAAGKQDKAKEVNGEEGEEEDEALGYVITQTN